MLRRVRLAASIVCFVLAIGLVALMVRSYWWFDMSSIASQDARSMYAVWHASSFGGLCRLSYREDIDEVHAEGWIARSLVPTKEVCDAYLKDQTLIPLAVKVLRSTNGIDLYAGIAHWVLATFLGLLGLFFASGRAAFSLRTALTTATAFTLLLGLHVGLMRAFS